MVGSQRGVFGGFGRRGSHAAHRSKRRSLLGLGVTGTGLATAAIAAAIGIGQVATSGTACAAALGGQAGVQALGRRAHGGAITGIATHYVLQGLPNCSYPSPPADGLFAAMSPAEYAAAAACGGYLEVTGPDGSVTVKVIDQCPECASGHIDLSEPAFARLAPLKAGLIKVSYRSLADPALPGPVTVQVKQGSSPYWLALLADNTGNPLAAVAVETVSGGWLSLTRADYNYWIAQQGAGSGPFTVRLTDTAGHQVTVHDITLSPGTVQRTGTWMYGAGSAPAPSAPAPSAPAPASAAQPSATTAAATAGGATPSASAQPGSRSPAPRAGTPSSTPTAKPRRAQVPAASPSPPRC